jgi:hypothetical protein
MSKAQTDDSLCLPYILSDCKDENQLALPVIGMIMTDVMNEDDASLLSLLQHPLVPQINWGPKWSSIMKECGWIEKKDTPN